MLKDLGVRLLDELLLVALEAGVRVWNAHLLARIDDVLEVLPCVVRDLSELTLASGACAQLRTGAPSWNGQAVDAALYVLVHRTVATRRPRHTPGVDSAGVGHGGVGHGR